MYVYISCVFDKHYIYMYTFYACFDKIEYIYPGCSNRMYLIPNGDKSIIFNERTSLKELQ